jgi:hydroxyacyl-ACP dehydratase HTD2-like protein with hotdog domain
MNIDGAVTTVGTQGMLEEIPELQIMPTAGQIFMFSAITWNRHHVHFSKDAALAEGHADIVVQRALLGNFMARHLGNWLGSRGQILQLSWKVQKSALPGNQLRCQGTAAATDPSSGGRRSQCTLRIVDHTGAVVASGAATVLH